MTAKQILIRLYLYVLHIILIFATNVNELFSFIYFQVRTLFVSGLPMDAKPRELYLLFRAYEVSG